MSNNGAHTITPAGAGKAGGNRHGSTFGAGICLFYACILIMVLHSCAADSTHASYSPPSLKARTLTISSSDASAIASPAITLTGGSYEFSYDTYEHMEDIKNVHSGDTIFVADFKNNTFSDNLKSADVIIIVGDVNIDVDAIAGESSLRARAVYYGRKISATFDYSHAPQAPPSSTSKKNKKKIIIVGNIHNINIGKGLEKSFREINIMELDPTAEEQEAFMFTQQQERRRKADIERYRYEAHRAAKI